MTWPTVRRQSSLARTSPLERLRDDPIRLVDVGARGGVDDRWARFHPYLEVVGFEPDPAECRRLNDAAGALPYRSRFLPHALGRERGQVTFHVCRWPVASSIYEPNPEFLADFPHAAELLDVTDSRPMATEPLDDVLGAERPTDCLKVDVEGAELEVLRGARATLAQALVLDVEVEFAPIFSGQPLFADVDHDLRERGWGLLGLRRIAWRRTAGWSSQTTGHGGQVVSADALYVNGGLLRHCGLSTQRALKAAAIMAAYRQHDYVLALLRQPPLSELGPSERTALQTALVPPPTRAHRLAIRMLGRLGSERRRRIADALHPGEAAVWQDAHHF